MDWPLRSRTRPPSRLLALPAEIRIAIYEFALSSETPVVAFRLDPYQRDDYQEAVQPPLTRVSRQVRHESLPVFYNCNVFVLHTEDTKALHTRRWLQCIEPHLAKLHFVSLWLRHVTFASHRRSWSQGALSVSLQRKKADGIWWATGRWKWITVLRKPALVESDAEFLIQQLNLRLTEDGPFLHSAEGFSGVLASLRLLYVKEKEMIS